MMDWSYALLSQPEQQLLNRLSVFAGDFDLKATEGICGAEYTVASDVFETLAQLVNKSLVVVDRTRGDDVRFLLHETIRQYAREKLEVTGETEKLKNFHAQFYGRMALDLHQGAKTSLAVNAIFDHEMGNLRAALHWLYAQEGFEELAQLCAILGDHWFVRGYINEGQEWLDRVLDQRPTLSLPVQGMVLEAKGKLLYERGEYGPAQALYEESLAIYRKLGDAESVAEVLNLEGVAVMMMGHFTEAAKYHQQSMTEYRKLGITRGIATNLNRLGFLAYCEKEYDTAVQLLQESLPIYEAEGDEPGEALALNGLGEIERARGDYVAAQKLYEQALALYKRFSENYSVAVIKLNLAHTAYQLGNFTLADKLFRESLTQFYELDNTKLSALSLIGLTLVASRLGDHYRAAILVGAARVMIQNPSSIIIGPADLGTWEEAVAQTNTWVGKETLDALDKGQKMSLAEVVAFALES